jgi:acyl-CoA thioester hydrolase
MQLKVRTSIPVRYAECDPMGTVHHSNYFIWFELGRIALAKQVGITFDKLPDGSVLHLPVVECRSRFKASAHYGDTVEVETVLARPSRARFDFTYRVFRQQGRQLLTEAATSHVMLRGDGQVLIHLPAQMQEKLDHYINAI